VLSDAPAETAAAIAGLPVARYFEHLIFSCELKIGKPDRPASPRRWPAWRRAADVIFHR